MKSYGKWLQWVAFGAVLCMIVGPAGAQATKPAESSPATRTARLEGALKYAPEGAAAIVHVQVKALMKEVLAGFAKDAEFKDLDANTVAELNKLAAKIDSVDLFFSPSPEGVAFPFVVLHGKLGMEDLDVALSALRLTEPNLVRAKSADGRYTAAEVFDVVVGGEAPELPAGVVVVGQGPSVTKEDLANLGNVSNEDLPKLVKATDTAAPIWLAVLMDQFAPAPDDPKCISGGVYLLGGGSSRIVAEFPDANAAQAAMADFEKTSKDEGAMAKLLFSVFQPTRTGAQITFVPKTKESLVPGIVAALAESRRETKKSVSMAYLRGIGETMAAYSADHGDKLPADLMDLVRAQAVPVQILLSPVSGKKVQADANGMPIGAFEPDYLLVKYPMSALKIKETDKKVLIYERPENYKNEGTLVLYVDGHAEWLKLDEFTKQFKATQNWIAEQAKTPDTAPDKTQEKDANKGK